MRTFPLKLSLLISSVHHTVFLFSCFCLGCFNVPSAASSSSSFCHTFDLLLSSKNILWTLGVNCFGFFSTRRILLSSCILHQDYLKLFASGDVQSQSFYFVEWMDGEKNTQTTATHEWRRGRDSEQTWMLLVSWRVLRVACANGIKRLTKRNNHNVCPFEPKMCAPTTRNFHSFLCPLNFHFFFLSLWLRSLSTS